MDMWTSLSLNGGQAYIIMLHLEWIKTLMKLIKLKNPLDLSSI